VEPPRETEEKPKLAFEKPGDIGSSPSQTAGIIRPGNVPAIRLPGSSLEDAIQEVARNRRGSGMVVGGEMPEDVGGILETRPAMPSHTTASTMKLLSDPKGVDFRPYLIRVLTSVRRNWRSVFPESARLGQRGKVVILFSIDRVGRIPKLVIFEASGAEALDRAAVAGISASDPFPPLPGDFSGDEIRLQLNFFYNMRQ
jgi:TonB family protein